MGASLTMSDPDRERGNQKQNERRENAMKEQGEKELLAKPWRKFKNDTDPWSPDVCKKLKDEIATHKLLEEAGLEFFNVLLIGQISAGKSSFYNTIESVFSKHVTGRADAGAVEQSLTTKFRTYKVKAEDNDNKPLAFKFCDTMGLSTESGLTPQDCGIIMDGQVPDGADLTEALDEGSRAYKEDRMHCLVFLVDASRMEFMDEAVIEKFAKIREQGTKRHLNPVVILTRIDECCVELNRDEGDITKVFHSKTVKDLVVAATHKFGVAQNMVFPVQNYSSENDKEMGIDILLLRALRQMLRCSKTCIEDMIQREREKRKQEERREAERQNQREKEYQTEVNDAEKKLVRLKTGPDQAPSKKKAAPSLPKILPPCTAIRSRPREADDELNMVEGQEFAVLKPDDGNGWVEVKNSSGGIGLVPADWIKMGSDTGTLFI